MESLIHMAAMHTKLLFPISIAAIWTRIDALGEITCKLTTPQYATLQHQKRFMTRLSYFRLPRSLKVQQDKNAILR
jgi:hypothetical protein